MKILSWNVWSEHKAFSKVIKFLKKQKTDIVCLQEVSKKGLISLKKHFSRKSGYHVAQAIDFYQTNTRNKRIAYYLVILSKLPFKRHKKFKLLNQKMDSFASQMLQLEESIEGHYVDVVYEEKNIRIINIHLQCFSGPLKRLLQLQHIFRYIRKTNLHVICGDFNTFGFPHINFFVGWFYNYAWEEFLLDEKYHMEIFLKKFQLQNVFNWAITYPFFGIALDHIFLHKELLVIHKKIFAYTYGSDHNPLMVKIALPKEVQILNLA